jgi:uncharacterized membrane protein
MITTVLYLHVLGGSAALLSMVVPMVTRKGGPAHRRAGWVFVAGMTVVSVTALVLAGARFALDPTAQGRRWGVFLAYVAVLTGASVSSGLRALREKRRTGPATHPWDLGLSGLLVAASAGIAVYGLVARVPLFAGFSIIGLLTGGLQLRYRLRAPGQPMHWWTQHMAGMLGASIAATTAFVVVNAPRLGAATDSPLVWLGPAAIGTPLTFAWIAYYRRRFASGARTAAAGSAQRLARAAIAKARK